MLKKDKKRLSRGLMGDNREKPPLFIWLTFFISRLKFIKEEKVVMEAPCT